MQENHGRQIAASRGMSVLLARFDHFFFPAGQRFVGVGARSCGRVEQIEHPERDDSARTRKALQG